MITSLWPCEELLRCNPVNLCSHQGNPKRVVVEQVTLLVTGGRSAATRKDEPCPAAQHSRKTRSLVYEDAILRNYCARYTKLGCLCFCYPQLDRSPPQLSSISGEFLLGRCIQDSGQTEKKKTLYCVDASQIQEKTFFEASIWGSGAGSRPGRHSPTLGLMKVSMLLGRMPHPRAKTRSRGSLKIRE